MCFTLLNQVFQLLAWADANLNLFNVGVELKVYFCYKINLFNYIEIGGESLLIPSWWLSIQSFAIHNGN